MQTKVMLVIPNAKWYDTTAFWHLHPYTLTLLASVLDKDRYLVKILDANIDNLTVEEFSRKLEEWNPDVVGVSILANEYAGVGHITAKCVKRTLKSALTILGGVYPTTRSSDALDDENVDYVVIGEGEKVFPALLDHIFGIGDMPVEGVGYRKEGKKVVCPQIRFIEDLDSLPFPDYSLIDFNRYGFESFKHVVDSPRALPYAKLITSRGCPIGCSFCQVEAISGKHTRFQSPERVLREIEWYVESFGVKAIEFLDDNFLGKRARSVEIFEGMARRKIPVVWNAMNVSEFFLTEELLELMRDAGCVYVSIAAESASPRILKDIICKPVVIEHVKQMVDKARSLGMDTTTLWVVGFPGETWDEIRHTIRVAEEIGADYTKINIAVPYPGTKLYDMALKGGYINDGFDFEDISWGKAMISTDEFRAEDLMILRAYEWDRINFSKPEKRNKIAEMMGVSLDELKKIRFNTLRSVNNIK